MVTIVIDLLTVVIGIPKETMRLCNHLYCFIAIGVCLNWLHGIVPRTNQCGEHPGRHPIRGINKAVHKRTIFGGGGGGGWGAVGKLVIARYQNWCGELLAIQIWGQCCMLPQNNDFDFQVLSNVFWVHFGTSRGDQLS